MKNSDTGSKADWRVLTAIKPIAFGTEGFVLFERDHWRAIKAIRTGMKSFNTARWEHNLGGLRNYFRFDDERQCFAEGRFAWTSFYEPQITRGLVHFLDTAPTQLRKSRCAAFARAVSACCKSKQTKIFPDDPIHVRVVAEEKRIDILVEMADEQGRFGVAIEAKFNHRLTKGQLEGAVAHISDRGWDLDRSCLLVVGPHLDRLGGEILDNNTRWSSVSWWALLRHLERELPIFADCAEFRRFRSTVWSQSYA